MNPMIKRVLFGIGFIFSFVLLLVVASILYLKTDHAQQIIQNRVNRTIPGNISWSRVDFSLLRGTVGISDLMIKGKADKKIASVPHLHIALDLPELLKRRIAIENILIEKPDVSIRVGENGQIDLVDAFYTPSPEVVEPPESKKNGVPFILELKAFKLSDGLFRYDTPSSHVSVKSQAFNISGNYDFLRQAGRINFRLVNTAIENPTFETTLSDVKLTAEYQQDQIRGFTFAAATPASDFSANGEFTDLFNRPSADLSITLKTSLSEVASMLKMENAFSGPATLNLTLSGAMENPTATLSASYGGGEILSRSIKGLDMNLVLENRKLSIRQVNLGAFSGDLNINGNVNFADAFPNGFLDSQQFLDEITYDIHLLETKMNIGELVEGAKGTFDSTLKMAGKGFSLEKGVSDMTMALTAKLPQPGAGDKGIDLGVNAALRLSGGEVLLHHLDAVAGNTKLKANGKLNIKKEEFHADLSLDMPDLNLLTSSLGLQNFSGDLHLTTTAKGPLKQPVADLFLEGNNISVQGVKANNVKINANLDPEGKLGISKLNITNEDSRITGKGAIHLFNEGFKPNPNLPLSVGLKLDNVDVARFVDKKGATGNITGDVNIKGALNNLAAVMALKGENIGFAPYKIGTLSLDVMGNGSIHHPGAVIRMDGADLTLSGQEIASFKMATEIKDEKLHINELTINVTPQESAEIGGWLSLEKTFYLSLASEGISLAHLAVIPESAFMQGKLSFNIKADGSIEDPRIEGGIFLKELTSNDKAIADMALTLDVNHHLAQLTGDPGFDLTGQYHLRNKAFSFSALFRETDLSPYFDFLDQPDLGGRVSGKLEMTGTVDAHATFRGFVDLTELGLSFQEKDIVKGKDLEISFNDDEISIPGIYLGLGENGSMNIAGSIKPRGPVSLNVTGEVPLSMARGIHEDLQDISGNLLLNFALEGETAAPQLRGELSLVDVRATIPYLYQELYETNGRLRIAPNEIRIENLSGRLDTGRFDLMGHINLEKYDPVGFSLNLSASTLPVNIPDTVDMVFDANLTLSGTPENSLVNGDLTLVEGLYYKDVNLNFLSNVTKKTRESAPAPLPTSPSYLDNTALNINVKHRNPFVVDNNLAMMDIVPDLKITGTAKNPIINGRADITEGTVTYRKKEFKIKKGVVDFLNPYKIEPTLDIQSEVQIRDWLVNLGITGPPDELAFKLSSDPPLDDGDILSLLLIGRTSTEMIAGEGGSNQSAQQLLTQALADALDEDIKTATGLDIVEAQVTGTSGNGNGSDVKVTLGKELSKRLTVKYTMETKKGEMTQGTIAEYKFLEDILVSGFQDNRGSFGGSIKYRLEFR